MEQNKVYQTADGFKFYTENLAKNHAINLKDKTITEVENKQFRQSPVNTENTAVGDIGALAEGTEFETSQEMLDSEKKEAPTEQEANKVNPKPRK